MLLLSRLIIVPPLFCVGAQMATLFQMMTLFTALWLAQSCHPCQGAEDTADAETIIVFFIHIHIGGNAYTHKTFQRYLGQFKGRRANIWGRKDWQCPIASIQRGFNSWLAECSVNHCRNFLLFNHLCTFLGIGSSIWSGLPSVYCQVFLNAGSSLNQSLLYFPLSPAKYILFCCCLLHNATHLYLPINPSYILSNPNARPRSRSFFLCSCTLSPHVMALVLTRVCFDRSFLGSRKKISAPGKTHKTPPPLFISFWTDNEV